MYLIQDLFLLNLLFSMVLRYICPQSERSYERISLSLVWAVQRTNIFVSLAALGYYAEQLNLQVDK